MEVKTHLSISEIHKLFTEDPRYEERTRKIQELTKDAWKIPTYDEVLEYINNSPSIYIRGTFPSKEDIEISLNLIKMFPDFHKYLVMINGDPKFPDFDLPLSIFSSLARYVGVLLQDKKNDLEVISIVKYLDGLYTSKRGVTRIYKRVSGTIIFIRFK